ncbi:MAG: hypothetical protein ABEK59_09100 [Halobacteria archaeon]
MPEMKRDLIKEEKQVIYLLQKDKSLTPHEIQEMAGYGVDYKLAEEVMQEEDPGLHDVEIWKREPTGWERDMLEVISRNPETPLAEIADELGKSTAEVTERWNELTWMSPGLPITEIAVDEILEEKGITEKQTGEKDQFNGRNDDEEEKSEDGVGSRGGLEHGSTNGESIENDTVQNNGGPSGTGEVDYADDRNEDVIDGDMETTENRGVSEEETASDESGKGYDGPIDLDDITERRKEVLKLVHEYPEETQTVLSERLGSAVSGYTYPIDGFEWSERKEQLDELFDDDGAFPDYELDLDEYRRGQNESDEEVSKDSGVEQSEKDEEVSKDSGVEQSEGEGEVSQPTGSQGETEPSDESDTDAAGSDGESLEETSSDNETPDFDHPKESEQEKVEGDLTEETDEDVEEIRIGREPEDNTENDGNTGSGSRGSVAGDSVKENEIVMDDSESNGKRLNGSSGESEENREKKAVGKTRSCETDDGGSTALRGKDAENKDRSIEVDNMDVETRESKKNGDRSRRSKKEKKTEEDSPVDEKDSTVDEDEEFRKYRRISSIWSSYLGYEISPKTVCDLLILMEVGTGTADGESAGYGDVARYAEMAENFSSQNNP